MFSFKSLRWVNRLFRQRARTIEKKPRFRLVLEELETRLAPASVWSGAAGNPNWSDPGNWVGGAVNVPVAGTPVDLIFSNTATSFSSNNNIPNLTVKSILVQSGTYTFTAGVGITTTLGDFSSNSANITVNTGASATFAGSMPIQIGTPAPSTEFFVVQNGATLTINGVLSGNSAAQLTKQGAGTLTLGGNNTGFTGPFKIDASIGAGVVSITHQNALGGAVASEVQTLDIGSALAGTTQYSLTYVNGAGNPTTGPLTFAGTAADATTLQTALNTLFNGLGFVGSPVTVTRTATVGSPTVTGSTFTIVFGGTMAGQPVLQLTPAVTTGPGSAVVNTPASADGGAASKATIDTNTQLQISIAAGGTIAKPIALNGAGPSGSTGAILNVTGNNTLSGSLEMSSANGIKSTTFGTASGTTLTITGQISNFGVPDYTLIKEGLGTLTLNPLFAAGNTYQGNTDINAGLLQISHPYALGPGGGTATVNSTVFKSGSLGIAFDPANTFVPAANLHYAKVQTLTLTGAVTGTTSYTVTYNGVTSAPITYNNVPGNDTTPGTDANLLRNALNGLATIGGIGASVSVTRGGTAANPVFTITFQGSLGGMDIPTLTGAVTASAATLAIGVTTGATPIGFDVPNQFLVLNGPGRAGVGVTPRSVATRTTGPVGAEITGALNNMAGHNSWAQNITFWSSPTSPLPIFNFPYPTLSIGAVANTNLTLNGVLNDNGVFNTTLYSFTKVGLGRLILTQANNIPVYDDILQGTLNIRDSNALGYNTGAFGGVEVWFGTTLELQADAIPDSDGSAGTYNLTFPTFSPIWLNGTGVSSQGALYSLAGTNRVDGSVYLRSAASIGVSPDPDPFNLQGQTSNNLSQLTINGVISDLTPGVATGLTKVGYGELVLTNANTYSGPTVGRYPTVTPQTRIAQGWITIQNELALGDIKQTSQGFLPPVQVDDGASLMLKEDLNGNKIEPEYNLFLTGLGIKHRYAWLNQMGALVNLSGANSIQGYITLNGEAGIGVELDGANAPTPKPSSLTLTPLSTGAIIMDGNAPGKIVKLGSQRLIILNAGTYTGGFDLRQGVVRIGNDNALGVGTPTAPIATVVNSGTALELGLTLPQAAGGSSRGLQIWNNQLVLNGTGNPTFGSAPLTVLGDVFGADHAWRGPISINSNIAINFKNQLGNEALAVLAVDNAGLIGGGTYTALTTTPGSSGINAVQTLTQNGSITGGTFRLTVVDPNGVSGQTAPIPWSANLPVLMANIEAALNALAPTFGGTVAAGIVTVAANSPIIDIAPNTRFVVTGAIDDSGAFNPGQLVHVYELNGNYTDALGGPSLVPTGGSIGPTGYTFNAGGRAAHLGANEGLSLAAGLAPGDVDYSIQMTVTINELPPPAPTNYIRLIDWLTGTPDDGLYIHNSQLELYPTAVVGPAGTFAAPGPKTFTLVITRSPAGTMTAYVDGILQFSGLDATNGVVSPTGNLNFFLDDVLSANIDEISSGSVDRILIYNRALSSSEVAFVTAGGYLGATGGAGKPANLTVQGGGELLLMGANTYRGTTVVNEGIVTIANGQALGQGPISEVQTLTLTGAGTTTFNLSFNGSAPTPNLTFTGTAADAANIAAALNALPTIGTVGGVASVVQTSATTFAITLGGTLSGFDQLPIVATRTSATGTVALATTTDGQGGTIVKSGAQLQLQGGITVANEPLQIQGQGSPAEPEVQTVTLGDASGGFALSFTNPITSTASTSVGLPVGASAIQVQAALNQMLSIQQGNGSGGGYVQVQQTNDGIYYVSFLGSFFGQSGLPLLSIAPVPVQIVAITGTSGSFTLNFTGNATTTVPLAPTIRASGGITTAESLENALNALLANASQPGGGAGKAMVLDTGVAGTFFVSFGGSLASPAVVPMLQASNFLGNAFATVSSINSATTFPSRRVQGGSAIATPLSWFELGPSPIENGQIFNSASPTRGDVTGRVTGVTTDPADPNVMYISTAGGGSWKTVNATAATPLWTPLFDSSSALERFFIAGKSGTFTLTFTNPITGASSTTPALPFDAPARQVSSALNGLASIGGSGASVIVGSNATPGTNETQRIDFTAGPPVVGVTQFNLTFGASTTPAPITYTGTLADAVNIQNALNALPSVGGVLGSVKVIQIVPGRWDVTFSGSLDQQPQASTITATIVGGTFTPTTTVPVPGVLPNIRYDVRYSGGAFENYPIPLWGSPTPALAIATSGGANLQSRIAAAQGIGATTPIFTGAIAIAPSRSNVLYAGTGEANNYADSYYGTGVYRSDTYGQVWHLVVDNAGNNPLAGLSISKIVVDPNNADRFWVATSDQSINSHAPGGGPLTGAVGIWRFDNGTWTNISNPVVAPTAPAGTTTDFTWSDLYYRNGTDTLVVAAGDSTGNPANGVYVVTNASTAAPTWSANTFPAPPPGQQNGRITLTGSGTTVFAFAANVANGVLVGTNVQFSNTTGAAFAPITAAPPANFLAGGGNVATAAVAANGNLAYFAGTDPGTGTTFVYRAQNPGPGFVWTDLSALDPTNGVKSGVHALALDANNNLIVATNGGMFRFNNATNTWSNLNGYGLGITQVFGVASSPSNPNNILIGATHVGTNQFLGDTAWNQVDTGSGGLVFFDPRNPNIVYHEAVSSAGGTIRFSSNGGATWATATGVPSGGSFFPFLVSPNSPTANSSTLIISGNILREVVFNYVTNTVTQNFNLLSGTNAPTAPFTAVAIATNQGTFKTDPDFPLVTDLGASNPDPNTVYVTDGVDIFVTKNHGQDWSVTSRTPALAPNTQIVDLQVDPTNRDHVYAIIGGLVPGSGFVGAPNQKRVFESFDAGVTWTDISTGLPDIVAYKLAIDPRSGDLYLGTDTGVYQLLGGVLSPTNPWKQFGAKLPNVAVTFLDLNQSTNVLTAGTYGRGAWQFFLNDTTTNSGALRSASGSNTWAGPVILAGPTTISAQGTQELRNGIANAQLTISGVISDLTPTQVAAGSNTLTKTGYGDLILSAANTYTGHTNVQQGSVIVKNPGALGAASQGTTVQNGAALQLQTSLSNEPLFLYGDGVQRSGHYTGSLYNSANNNTYNGVATLMTNVTIGVATGSSLILDAPGSIIDGAASFSLTKEGTGKLTLKTGNSYGGGTFVNQGILNVQHVDALGDAGTTTRVLDTAQLQVETAVGGSLNMTLQNLILSGSGISGTGALLNIAGTNTWNGNVLFDNLPGFAPSTSPTNSVALGANAGSTIKINGVIDDPFARTGQPGVPLIEVESNNTIANANVINLPANTRVRVNGSITSGDSDFYRFTLTSRSGVFLDIDSREIGLSSILDSRLRLYDSTGTLITQNQDGYDFDTGWPAPTQAGPLTGDSALYADLNPGTYYVEVSGDFSTTGNYLLKLLADTDFSNTIPVLNSNPTASDTVYLDFDGHADTDAWGTYNMPGFDFNGNLAELTPGEKLAIRNIWRMVAEDYAPFNINVSTNYAGPFTDGVAHRMVITSDDGTGIGSPGILGIAFISSYSAGGVSNQTAWVFAPNFDQSFNGGSSGQIMATALEQGNTTAHEFGHALGLEHFATSTGSAGPADVIPNAIIATPDTGLNREIWAAGINELGVFQDDMAVISNATNTFGYRVDDHGDTISTATVLPDLGGGTFQGSGIISQIATDVDYFRFTSAGGMVTISANVDDYVNDLDARLRIFTSLGVQVGIANPSNSFDASLTLNLPAGIYYAEVSSNGDNGSAGQYTLSIAPASTTSGILLNPTFTFGLDKVGLGAVVLMQDNRYNGVTNVLQGELIVQNGGALGTNNYGTVVASGASLVIDGDPTHANASINVDEALSLNGSGFGSNGALRNLSGSNTQTGGITLQSNASIGADPGSSLQINSAIQNPNPAPVPPASITPPNLTKVGTGTVILNAASPYTGSTTVSAGVLQVQNPTALGLNTTAVQAITVSGTSGTFTVFINGFPAGINTGPLPFNVTASALETAINTMLANPAAPGGGTGTVTVVRQATGNVFTVTFGGSLSRISVPLLTTPVANFTGNTFASVAQLLAGGASTTTVSNGATLLLTGNITEASGKTLNLNGLGFQNQGALNNVGANTWSAAPIVLASNASVGSSSGTLIIDQAINQSGGSRTLTKVGTGTVQFAGTASNTYNGTTFVRAGTLELNKTFSPIDATAIEGNLQVGENTAVSQVQTLDLSSFALGNQVTFTYNGSAASAAIAHSTNPAYAAVQIQNALNSLSTITPGSVTVTPRTGFPGQYLITLALGGANPAFQVAANNVTTSATVNATITTPGAAPAAGAAVARNLNDFQMNSARNITVLADGLYDLNNRSETVATLSIIGGTATTGASAGGTLNVTNLSLTGGALNLPGAGATVNVANGITMAGGTINLSGSGSTVQMTSGTPTTVSATSTAAAGSALITGQGTFNLGTATRTFDIADGPQNSDLIVSSVVSGNTGVLKTNTGRVEFAAANTYTGVTQINVGDVQVDELGRQLLNLSTLTAGSTFTLAYSNGSAPVASGNITYTGTPATDATAIKNSLIALLNSLFVTGTVDVFALSATLFEIVFTGAAATNLAKLGATLTSGSGTPTAASVNNIGPVVLNGGSLSGTGTVGAVSMLSGAATGTANPGVNGTPTTTGLLEANGTVVWTTNTTFFVHITNNSGSPVGKPGVDNDQLFVNGSITLGNALLTGDVLGGSVNIGDTYTILQATNPINAVEPTTGTVPGNALEGIINGVRTAIPQDGAVFLNGQKFTLHYYTDRIVLTRQFATFTTFTFSSSANPSVYGQEVTITAVAVPEPGASFATANPKVTFSVDGSSYTHTFDLTAAGPLPGSRQISFTPQSFFGILWDPGSSHVITSTFTDTFHVFATASAQASPASPLPALATELVQVVNQNTVTITPSNTPLTPAYGQDFTLTASLLPNVIPNVTSASNPTGTVTFVFDRGLASELTYTEPIFPTNAPFPPNPVTANRTVLGNLLRTPGNHTVEMTYSGDFNYAPITTPVTLNLTIVNDNTTLSFVPASTPSKLGQNATFTVTVNPATVGSIGVPSGTLTFRDGSAAGPILGTVPYNGATVQFQNNTLTVGSHNIFVTFTPSTTAPGSYFNGVTSSFTHIVQMATTQTTITSFSPSAPTFGQQVTFNVQVVKNPVIAATFGVLNGNVNLWKDAVGGTLLGNGALNASGTVSIQTATGALPVGTYPIVAEYVSNGIFDTSTFTIPAFTVVGAATTTTVTVSIPYANGSPFGTTVQLNAAVTSAVGSVPNGTHVTFWDGPVGTGTNLGTGTITGGSTFISVALPFAGSRTINAVFTDDNDAIANFANSTGTKTAYLVTGASTSVSLGASPLSGAVYGEPVTLTANVNSLGGTVNSGNVTFRDGATILGTAPVVAGVAMLSTASIPAGNRNLTASFADTTTFFNGPTTNGSLPYTVGAASTEIKPANFTSSVAIGTAGTPLTLTAKVTTISPSTAIVNAGSVTFYLDNLPGSGGTALMGTYTFNSTTGTATLSTSGIPFGTHTIYAVYDNTPSANFVGGATQTLTQIVRYGSSVSITPNPVPTTGNIYGQTLPYVVTVNPPAGLVGAPVVGGTLTVTATIGGVPTTLFGPTAYTGPGMSVPINGLPVGTHSLSFSFSGDSNYVASAGTVTQAIQAATTSTTLDPTTDTAYGNPIEFVARVTSPTAAPPTTGTVSFYRAGTVLLGTVSVDSFGVARLTTTATQLVVGNHSITAKYNPPTTGANYKASTAPAVTQKITQAVTSTTVSFLPTSPITFGTAVQFSATVTIDSSLGLPGSLANPTAGTVTFKRKLGTSIVTIGSAKVNTSGIAIFTTTATALPPSVTGVGYYEITASYSSGSTFIGNSVSSAENLEVDKADVSVTLSSNPVSTQVYGNTVTFTAIVQTTSGGAPGTPTGTVSFYGGATGTDLLKANVALVRIDATSARAIFTTSATQLPALSHTIKAVYNGSANFNTNEGTQGFDVTPAVTTTTLSSTPTYWPAGQITTFYATVAVTSGGKPGLPAGNVFFDIDGTIVSSPVVATAVNGVTVYRATAQQALAAGSRTVSATFVPSTGNFAGSPAAPLMQDVRVGTLLDFTSTSTNTGVNITATVSAASGAPGGPPTGVVRLYENGILVGTITLSGVNGTTSKGSVVGLPLLPGNHTITAVYEGDTSYNPADKKKTIAGQLKRLR